MKFARLLLIGSPLFLSSCTLIATKIASEPPGIHQRSFRECLLDNGFFTPTALEGIAKNDYLDIHAEDEIKAMDKVSRKRILQMPSPEFVSLTTKIIRRGLFPHVQYGKGQSFRIDQIDRDLNRPYVSNVAPPPYQAQGWQSSEVPLPSLGESRQDIALNRYLDCYIGPVGENESGLSITGDDDTEGRLLRGHILLTLLAKYGTELITSRPGHRQQAQAERLLSHLRSAELSIRSGSLAVNPAWRDRIGAGNPDFLIADDKLILPGARVAQESLRWYGYAGRVMRLFQLSVDIQVVDGQQSLDRATNIISAFASGNIAAFVPILKDALKGFETVQKIGLFGDALLRDARETLAVHRASLKHDAASRTNNWTYDVKKTRYAWRLWDLRLNESCQQLALIAKASETRCVPGDEALKAALDNEIPVQGE